MRFMLDNNLSPRLARALNALTENDGDSVDHLRSRGLDAEPDEVYISELAKEGSWVVVTCDTSMARKPHEVKAWIDSGLVFVMLKHGWIAGVDPISWTCRPLDKEHEPCHEQSLRMRRSCASGF